MNILHPAGIIGVQDTYTWGMFRHLATPNPIPGQWVEAVLRGRVGEPNAVCGEPVRRFLLGAGERWGFYYVFLGL